MTQIWCVSVCLSVCLLKLSLLYPAPHMDTAMLRISPSFLTKPSEQPAKNNITCSLRSGPRPPWRRHYRGRGGRSWYGLKSVRLWPPRLQLIQNTDQSFCCKLKLHKSTERSWGGRVYISGHPPSIYSSPRLDRGHFKLFSDTKHVPTQSPGGFILQQARLALLGWAQNCFNSSHSPCCEWAKIETERGDVLKGGTEEGLG